MAMRLPSNMVHQFSQVPAANIQRSSFDRSSNYKTTLNAGLLIPIFWDEALPGDTFSMNMTGFCRLATPLHPLMDNIFFNTFFFAVPFRLLWSNWEKFNGEQTTPGDSTDYLIPQIVAPAVGFANGTIYDYLGLPTLAPNITFSPCTKAMPVTLEPGSSFNSIGSGLAVTAFLRTIVNGYCRKTAARPASNRRFTTDGLQGVSGFRLVSKTKT